MEAKDVEKKSTPHEGVRTMAMDRKRVTHHDTTEQKKPTPVKKQSVHMPTERNSLLSADDDVFDVSGQFHEGGGDGTIVTDKRGSRHSILDTLGSAANEWTGDRMNAVKELDVFQRPNAPKVAPGTQRKEVLQKAIDTKRYAPRDDHAVVIERLRTLQNDAERVTGKPFTIIKKDPKKSASWTHTVGEPDEPNDAPSSPTKTNPLASAPAHPSPTRTNMTPAVSPTTTTGSPSAAPEVANRIDARIEDYLPHTDTPVRRDNIIAKDGAEDVAPTTDVRVASTESAVPEKPIASQETEKTIPAPPSVSVQDIPEAGVPRLPRDLAPQSTAESSQQNNPLSAFLTVRYVSIVALVLIVVGGIGAGSFYLATTYFESPLDETSPTIVAFMSIDDRQSVALSGDRATLLTTLRGTIDNQTVPRSHIALVYQSMNTTIPATTGDFFAILNVRAPSTFVRSLESRMMLGGIRTDEAAPYMILKSHDFDTTFAGMLAWETFISADLAPLYGQPVVRSFDSTARTADRTSAPRFIDRRIEEYNVRILHDEVGAERIVYGFTNQNTLILTTTAASFATLAAALEE